MIRFLIFLSFCLVLTIGSNVRWFRIFVEKQKINARTLLQQKIESISKTESFAVTQIANQFEWAFLACVMSPTELLLISGRISPFYKNLTQESYMCFTRMQKDLVFGSSITGTGIHHPGNEHKNEQNLIQGFYIGSYDQCCYFESDDPLWIQIDFGTPRTFQTVSMTTLTITGTVHLLRPGDIWIGNTSSSSPGDFSGFKHFASYSGFVSFQTKAISNSHKVTSRYVGIKQNSHNIFYLCSLSIL